MTIELMLIFHTGIWASMLALALMYRSIEVETVRGVVRPSKKGRATIFTEIVIGVLALIHFIVYFTDMTGMIRTVLASIDFGLWMIGLWVGVHRIRKILLFDDPRYYMGRSIGVVLVCVLFGGLTGMWLEGLIA